MVLPYSTGNCIQHSVINHEGKEYKIECVCVFVCSVEFDSAIPWTVACQSPLSMEFSRQEYWSRLLLPTPWDFPNPGIKHASLVSPALEDRFLTVAPPRKPTCIYVHIYIYNLFISPVK